MSKQQPYIPKTNANRGWGSQPTVTVGTASTIYNVNEDCSTCGGVQPGGPVWIRLSGDAYVRGSGGLQYALSSDSVSGNTSTTLGSVNLIVGGTTVATYDKGAGASSQANVTIKVPSVWSATMKYDSTGTELAGILKNTDDTAVIGADLPANGDNVLACTSAQFTHTQATTFHATTNDVVTFKNNGGTVTNSNHLNSVYMVMHFVTPST